MIWLPPRATRPVPSVPYTPLFRSVLRCSVRPAAWVSIAAVGSSSVAAIALLVQQAGAATPRQWDLLWVPLAHFPEIRLGLLVDGLSAPMLVLVSQIGRAHV